MGLRNGALPGEKGTGSALSFVWLALGSLSFAFIGFRWSIVAAAWVAPVFLIRFFRNQKRWYGTLPAILFLTLGACAKFLGFWDFPLLYQFLVSALLPLPFYLALYADRALARLPSVTRSLVYPAVFVSVEYLMGKIPNFGTTGSIAVSQFPALGLIQPASVTGIWGISFLTGWFASSFNLLWEANFDLRSARNSLLPFLACTALVILSGSIRSSAL